MRLTVRLFGIEWIDVELTRDEVEFADVPACIACEDSGDPCAACGLEEVDAE